MYAGVSGQGFSDEKKGHRIEVTELGENQGKVKNTATDKEKNRCSLTRFFEGITKAIFKKSKRMKKRAAVLPLSESRRVFLTKSPLVPIHLLCQANLNDFCDIIYCFLTCLLHSELTNQRFRFSANKRLPFILYDILIRL